MDKEEYENRENNITKVKKEEKPKKEQSTHSFWVWSIVIGLGVVFGWGIVKNILLFIAMFFISAFGALLTPTPWVCLVVSFVITVLIKKL